MMIDSHAHLDDVSFSKDREEMVSRFGEDGLVAVINPGSNARSSERAVEIARRVPQVFAAVGTHPHDAEEYDVPTERLYRKLAELPYVVAIGEIGLDYYYEHADRAVQRRVFIEQIALADKLDLPIIVHNRDATQDCLDILTPRLGARGGVMHCFSDNWHHAQAFLELGMYISVSGIVTFKNADDTREVAVNVPLDRLLIETDSPYLTPAPHRGKRNEPAYVRYVAERIAKLRGIPLEELLAHTNANAARLFGLPPLL